MTKPGFLSICIGGALRQVLPLAAHAHHHGVPTTAIPARGDSVITSLLTGTRTSLLTGASSASKDSDGLF